QWDDVDYYSSSVRSTYFSYRSKGVFNSGKGCELDVSIYSFSLYRKWNCCTLSIRDQQFFRILESLGRRERSISWANKIHLLACVPMVLVCQCCHAYWNV